MVSVNDNNIRKLLHNGKTINVWNHNGIKVYGGSGTLYKKSTKNTFSANTSERELTTESAPWNGDIDSGIFAISGNNKYRLTANCDISEVTITLLGSQWQVINGAVTLRLGYSKNGAWGGSIIYKYYGTANMQYYSKSSQTFKNLKKGDYITLRILSSGDSSATYAVWFSTYTVEYKL